MKISTALCCSIVPNGSKETSHSFCERVANQMGTPKNCEEHSKNVAMRLLTLWTRIYLSVIFILAGLSSAHGATQVNLNLASRDEMTSIFKLIPYRDAVVVVSYHWSTLRKSVKHAEFSSNKTSDLKIEGMDRILDAETFADGIFFLGMRANKLILKSETRAGKEMTIEVPDPLLKVAPKDIHLISTSNKAAMITGRTLWWFEGEWKSCDIPEPPQFYYEFKPMHLGNVQFLQGSILYAGWNRGEWGGMLASIDLKQKLPKWLHLSGKKNGDSSGVPGNKPILEMISPNGDDIWVTAGTDHLDGMSRGMYHCDSEKKWEILIDGERDTDRGLIMPSPRNFIRSLTCDPHGRVYVLAGDAVFNVSNNSLASIVEICVKIGYGGAMAVTKNGDIFISTGGFGILTFRKEGNNWQGKQILLDN